MSKTKAQEAAIQAYWNDLKGMDLNDILSQINETMDKIDELEPWLEALIARRDQLAPPKKLKDFVL